MNVGVSLCAGPGPARVQSTPWEPSLPALSQVRGLMVDAEMAPAIVAPAVTVGICGGIAGEQGAHLSLRADGTQGVSRE